tara:strand:- start:22857 stop:23123 length:267 start_codon:yes stop_codon:yes gene_type:complete
MVLDTLPDFPFHCACPIRSAGAGAALHGKIGERVRLTPFIILASYNPVCRFGSKQEIDKIAVEIKSGFIWLFRQIIDLPTFDNGRRYN